MVFSITFSDEIVFILISATSATGPLHLLRIDLITLIIYDKKVNQSRYRPGVAQRVPGILDSQIS